MWSSFNFEFERPAWFHACAIVFLSYGILIRKSHNKKAENNLFQFRVCLLKSFVFVTCFTTCFMTLKWLKILKLSKICLNMIKAMTLKQSIKTFCFWMNGYYSSETLVCQTQDVCGRFQSENWTEHVSTGYSYVLIYRRKSAKCCKKQTLTKRPHSPHFAFKLIQIFLCFSYETNIKPSNCGKIFEKCMKTGEQIQTT